MIVVLGAFDGFHKGHQALFDAASKMTLRLEDSWGVVTFSPHPQAVLSSDGFTFLFTEREREILARFFGIPELVRIQFTRKLAEMEPEDFVCFLEERFFIRGLVVGEDFRFGRLRKGNASMLKELAHVRGWQTSIVPQVSFDGDKISSSKIRVLVSLGDVRTAGNMLGYPFFLNGSVSHGEGRGRSLGFPTANIVPCTGKILPDRGVYAGAAAVEGEIFPAAINIGFNPTFEGIRSLRVEAHIVGFKGDIYNKKITIFFLEKIRQESKFLKVEELVEQIKKDVKATTDYWKREKKFKRVISMLGMHV
ncbi:riboflavin biosynthesis protein RibF [Thermovirga lienii DSM 17291]|uniref:Riboflavin biosynthesis protein n=1 Tax=Thermovirga lienii (strain ATCC BAA-1197 / DSM 17291 / Cas60314) TaxID=580340 RepID=G7V9W2_THELD|nr:bifunctional riboflavin kinase/FAD synthetase [Thermovirga lienii]AER66662.1 riboflavin biosynthesis protein RibF [Thermovirga lienii DSM 17291]